MFNNFSKPDRIEAKERKKKIKNRSLLKGGRGEKIGTITRKESDKKIPIAVGFLLSGSKEGR